MIAEMYVCVCNVITDRQVSAAIDSGVRDWKEVHAFYGYVPNCGQCECEIQDQIIRQHSVTSNSLIT